MNDFKYRFKTYFFRNPEIKEGPVVTFVTLGLCLIIYILQYVLGKTYGDNNAAIALGAYYRNYVIVLNQYWRFLTYGFTHGSITHIFMNMYALCSLGAFLENYLGHRKFACVLYLSVIVGGLLIHVTGSEFVVGLSGGLYGLLGTLAVIAYRAKWLENPAIRNSFLRTIGINLLISLMPSVSLMGHLGGLVTGVLFGFLCTMPEKEKKSIYFYNLICAICILIGSLSYLAYRDQKIVSYYSNDLQVLSIYDDFGLNVDDEIKKIRDAWWDGE